MNDWPSSYQVSSFSFSTSPQRNTYTYTYIIIDTLTELRSLHTALQETCWDLELNAGQIIEQSTSRDNSALNPSLGGRLDLAFETMRQSSINNGQDSRFSGFIAKIPVQSNTNADCGLQRTTRRVVNVDQTINVIPQIRDKGSVTSSKETPSTRNSKRCRTLVKRTPLEKEHSVAFLHAQLSAGLSYEDIRTPYEIEFGVLRSAVALRCYYSTHKTAPKRQYKRKKSDPDCLVLKIPSSRLREISGKTSANNRSY